MTREAIMGTSTLKFACYASTALVLAGCAGPLASLTDSETDRAIESAAADTSFPSAAEAGVAASSL